MLKVKLKMISLIVLIIFIVCFIYLFNLLFSSGLTFFVNVCILGLAAAKAKSDIKGQDRYGFYLAASLLTVVLFIAKDVKFIAAIFTFFSKASVLPISIALIFIIFFAHTIQLSYIYGKEYWPKLVEFLKQKISKLRK